MIKNFVHVEEWGLEALAIALILMVGWNNREVTTTVGTNSILVSHCVRIALQKTHRFGEELWGAKEGSENLEKR